MTILVTKPPAKPYFFSEIFETRPREYSIEIRNTLNRLFQFTLSDIHRSTDNFERFVAQTSTQMHTAVQQQSTTQRAQATHALISLLATDKTDPTASLINDLAEILFLKRACRREYVENRETAGPFLIAKLLLEYAVFAEQLDRILGQLSKPFCANSCDRLPVGCCSVLGYDMGLVPHVMLTAQKLEAQRYGWSRPKYENKCPFHSQTGCVISLFKSPACIGFLCDELIVNIKQQYPVLLIEPFLKALTTFRNCDIDRKKVFDSMRAVIETAQPLLSGHNSTHHNPFK